jgi:hypothetical protein
MTLLDTQTLREELDNVEERIIRNERVLAQDKAAALALRNLLASRGVSVESQLKPSASPQTESVPTKALRTLATKPDGSMYKDLVSEMFGSDRTAQQDASLRTALRRLVDRGAVVREGNLYRVAM